MLAAEDLDVVSVCTPSFLHHDYVVDAAQSAAAPDVIWCEKPIASRVSAAQEMVAVCEETDTELLVNHSFRFTEKLQRFRDLVVEEGLLGDVRSVSTQYRMELIRNSTHVLDTLVYLLDARAEQISGYITGENEAVDSLDADADVVDAGGGGHVVMDDGTFVTVDCTIPRDISSMTLNFIGTEGKLYMNNDDGEWRYWSLEDGEHVEEPLPGIDGSGPGRTTTGARSPTRPPTSRTCSTVRPRTTRRASRPPGRSRSSSASTCRTTPERRSTSRSRNRSVRFRSRPGSAASDETVLRRRIALGTVLLRRCDPIVAPPVRVSS